MFLQLNGQVTVDDEEAQSQMVIAVAGRGLDDLEKIADRLRDWCRPG